jgi:CMP-N,N'-diacetyllegionaminic acid synthase
MDSKNSTPTCVALIPARSGSKRVPDKNIKLLAGHPLIAYSISAALQSGVFAAVIVSTDSQRYAEVARTYGAEVPFMRPAEYSGDTSPDIEWVECTLRRLAAEGRRYDCFSILRPTSPFRLPETIQRAWAEFCAETGVDSLRAVEKCSQHPAKMWVVRGRRMLPLLPIGPAEQPWHSSQYPSLPEVYVQNASLEIAWSRVVFEGHTISGTVLMPFFTRDAEGFDVNKPYDWDLAEHMVQQRTGPLPSILKDSFMTKLDF